MKEIVEKMEENITVPIPNDDLEELRVKAKEFYEWYQSKYVPLIDRIVFDCYGVTILRGVGFVPKDYILK